MVITKEYLYEEFIVKNRTEDAIGDELYNKYGKFRSISYYLEKFGLRHMKGKYKYKVNEDRFNLFNPVFCYFLGLLLTDGFIHAKHNYVAITLTNSDAGDILSLIKDDFEFEGPVTETFYGPERKSRWTLRISSDKLVNYLVDVIGVERGGNKSLTVPTPKKFFTDVGARMFFRGVLDGDGNIHCSKGKVVGQFRVVKGSVPFISGVINFLNKRLGFNYKLAQHKRGDVSYPRLEMRVADSKVFYDWVYGDNLYPAFRFAHKYSLYLRLCERLSSLR